MTITRIVSTTLVCSALAAAAAAQRVGPGPVGPAPGAFAPLAGPPAPSIVFAPRGGPRGADLDDRADDLYEQGRDAIEEGKYDRAIDRFNRLIDLKTSRTDAALYWKAYSQSKLGQRADALATLGDLQKQFAASR